MPTNYEAQGNVLLSGVTFNGTEGAPGSSLNWGGLFSADDTSGTIVDQDDDGRLDAGVDTFASGGATFTGYTISGGDGVEYPVFTDGGGNYALVIPDATTQTLVANSGTSNTFQSETSDSNVYLCFGKGTLISTPEGARAVETLSMGDPVLTPDGRSVPVKWVWTQKVSTRFGPADRLQPVRLRAGALGEGLPQRDLVLTADHALLIDGVLVNASALVNGDTIDWLPLSELGESFAVYHIETEDHEIILAEATPSETYIDHVGRRSFDNYADYIAQFGEEPALAEMPMPRVSSRRLLPPALKARLAGNRAA
ncbi:hypothetical protein KU6B_30380 [Mameliella alba]|uniref:Hint domain-containing protein n=1 Tax=Mameliella alba TaxID=561184 RepID=UPI0013E4CB8B|nr:Hint domain-containing protein [Mameliella alba]BBU56773.1 hypothetical protein KU6B_30380 [Mameliella alba]